MSNNENKKRRVLNVVWNSLPAKTKCQLQPYLRSRKTGVKALNKNIQENATTRYPLRISNRAQLLEPKIQTQEGAQKACVNYNKKIINGQNQSTRELYKRAGMFANYNPNIFMGEYNAGQRIERAKVKFSQPKWFKGQRASLALRRSTRRPNLVTIGE